MDWTSIAKISQQGFRDGVNDWIGKARIQGGQVQGSAATLTPGSLVSDGNVENKVLQALVNARVPPDLARALARELSKAWDDWAGGFQIHVPRAYPSLAAFPGPSAPPTPAASAIPVAHGNSLGEASLKSAVLAQKLTGAVRMYASQAAGSPDQAMKNLAAWVEISFNQWKASAQLVGMTGHGPVPTFAPPYVPVGPVLKGVNASTGSLFAGPRFGMVIT